MTDAIKAKRFHAHALAIEKHAHEHPPHVEMGLRDIAARFRFNALLHGGADNGDLLEAGSAAAEVVLKIATREELRSALEHRFCMRCLGIQIIDVIDAEGTA